MRALHAPGVFLRAEQQHAAVRGAVRLHALEALLRVVEHQRGGVQRQRMVRLDAGRVPAAALGVIHDEHMVGVMAAEAQIFFVRLRLRRGGFGNPDLFHFLPPLPWLRPVRLPAPAALSKAKALGGSLQAFCAAARGTKGANLYNIYILAPLFAFYKRGALFFRIVFLIVFVWSITLLIASPGRLAFSWDYAI